MQEILIKLLPTNLPLLEEVLQAHKAILERERAQVLDFDPYSKHAWHLLNKKYARSSGSQQYEAAFDVASDIGKMFRKMLGKANTDLASYGTRRSAAVTMRKILKSVLLAGDCLGRYVHQNCYGLDDEFMTLLNEAFDEEELEKLAGYTEKGVAFIDQVQEVADLAKEYCILGRLSEAVQLLDGQYGEGEEDDEEEEEEEDEKDEEEEDQGDEDDEDGGEDPVETGPGPWSLNYSRPPTIAHLLN